MLQFQDRLEQSAEEDDDRERRCGSSSSSSSSGRNTSGGLSLAQQYGQCDVTVTQCEPPDGRSPSQSSRWRARASA